MADVSIGKLAGWLVRLLLCIVGSTCVDYGYMIDMIDMIMIATRVNVWVR